MAASVAVGLTSSAMAFTPDVKPAATTIAAGDTHTLVLTPDGRIYGSGDTGFSAMPGVSAPSPYAVSTLTLIDALPGGVKATAVAAGSSFSLALGADGAVYGAGTNGSGQLTSAYGSTAVPVWTKLGGLPAGSTVTDIAANSYSTVVRTSSGQVYGAGRNSDSQLTGAGGTDVSTLTLLGGLPAGVTATKIAVGGWYDSSASPPYREYTLVLGSDGVLYGAGYNTYGQLSGASTASRTSLTPFTGMPAGTITGIAAGGSTSYVLIGGKVWSFGRDSAGQRGCGLCGTAGGTAVLMTGAANDGILGISAGRAHVAALTSSKILVAGSGSQNQLDQGTFGDATTLVAVKTSTATAVELDASNDQVVMRTGDGEVYGVGYNQYKQLTGSPSTVNALTLLTGQKMIPYGVPTLPAVRFGTSVPVGVERVWSVKPTNTSYKWSIDGVAVLPQSGGSAFKYVPKVADVGKQLRVSVTGSRDGYADTAPVASNIVTVLPGLFSGGQVSVTGAPGVGQTLTAASPALIPTPDASGIQWFRGGSPIAGATGSTYSQVAGDAGQALKARFTATAAGYDPYVSSASSGVVPMYSIAAPRIKGTAKVGKKLKIRSKGSWAPAPASYSYQWLRNGKAIKKATKTSYQLTKKDKGKRITVRVTASKPGVPSAAAVSKRTGKVKK